MDARALSFQLNRDGKVMFTHADTRAMVEAGLIDPEARFELLRGEIFDMASEGYAHQIVRLNLLRLLYSALSSEWLINTDGSLFLSPDTEVRPDIAIYKVRGRNTLSGSELALVVEIMASSQRRDREIKLPIYAENGVPELWLIDLETHTIEVCRDPSGATYATRQLFAAGEPVTARAFPELVVRLGDMLA
jgi:Uma2 family endonuclease